MTASAMWATIDPTASANIGASGISEDGAATDPSRQTRSASGIWQKVPHSGFAVVVGGTALLLYYVFDHGAGANAGGHVGKESASLDAELKGPKS